MQPKTLSAGVIVVRRAQQGWLVLLLRAYQNWDFPKGRVEADETPLAAARRETAEETGVTELDFRWGEAHVETEPYGRGKVARYHLAETPQAMVQLGINPELGRPEHHEFRWVTLDEADAMVPPRLRPVVAWARARLDA